MAIPPEWRSLPVTPPVTEVLDHQGRIAVNGHVAGVLEIRIEVNRPEPINAVQGVRGLRIKLDSLKGYRRDYLDSLFVDVFRHDNDDVVAPTELYHAVESRGENLMHVKPRAPKQEIEGGL